MEAKTIQTSGDFIDRDAEKAFLGALLLDWNAMGEASSKIHPEDFFYGCNKLIYATMQSLYGKVPQLDLVILVDELRKQNLLDQAGGAAYVACLTDQVPSSKNINHYIKNIKECKANRDVKDISGEISEDASFVALIILKLCC